MRLAVCLSARSALLIAVAACRLSNVCAQSDPVSDAVTALQNGSAPAAEQLLRKDLRAHPNDVAALDLLGVVLDKESKFPEAEESYRRALRLAAPSPGLLNNFGNHLLATGNLNEARTTFLKVLALDPAHANAHVQLARLSMKTAPATALHYLNELPASARETATARLVRMQVLYLLHRDTEANSLLSRLSGNEPAFEIGQALAAVDQYERAEKLFEQAAQKAPRDFEVLHDLGIAASHAGHNERAKQALEAALAEQPQNVDVLYDLAAVNAKLNAKETAVEQLAQAAQLAPDRAEVQALLARTTADLGYYGDAIQAWQCYMQLVPADDMGRRERGFMQTALGENGGLSDLEWFARKHPNDPVGHYELGVALSVNQRAEALAQFDRALALQPDFAPALVARALLNYREGNPRAALSDLERASTREPDNARILDRLGQTYLALDRPSDAVPTLRKAAALAPRDSSVLLHLSHALAKTGETAEASAIMARFRELGPNRASLPHTSGLVSFLNLSPQEQYAQYRVGVERAVRSNPRNTAAQVQYMKLLLDDGKLNEAQAVSRQILALNPTFALLADAAHSLLAAEQYKTAKTFIEQAITIVGPTKDLELDLAIADWHNLNVQAGLEQLNHVSGAARTGDYYLARAAMLNETGHFMEGDAAARQALQIPPTHSESYLPITADLARRGQATVALQLANQAAHSFPDDPEILLLKACALASTGKTDLAERLLVQVENRWPEWPKTWLAHALILERHGKTEQVNQLLNTAQALGDHTKTSGEAASDLWQTVFEHGHHD